MDRQSAEFHGRDATFAADLQALLRAQIIQGPTGLIGGADYRSVIAPAQAAIAREHQHRSSTNLRSFG